MPCVHVQGLGSAPCGRWQLTPGRFLGWQVLPPFPEPKRGKLHWDYLLEEMKWMSAEFARCGRPS